MNKGTIMKFTPRHFTLLIFYTITIAFLGTAVAHAMEYPFKIIIPFLRDDDYKVAEPTERFVEKTTKAIIKIDSNPRWKQFRFDPARNFQCNLTTIEEAIAGIAAEEQGLLHNLVRETSGGSEFVDTIKKVWDVKTPKSFSSTGKYIFSEENEIKEFINGLKKSLNNKPSGNFLVNISFLQNVDHIKLYNELVKLSKEQLGKIIIIDASNVANSKTTHELLKYLGKL